MCLLSKEMLNSLVWGQSQPERYFCSPEQEIPYFISEKLQMCFDSPSSYKFIYGVCYFPSSFPLCTGNVFQK